MEELKNLISLYKEKNSISDDDLAKHLSVSKDVLNDIELGKSDINDSEIARLKSLLQNKPEKTKSQVSRMLDLIFRLVATIMPLVVIILSIYKFGSLSTLISLLAVGVACLSMTTLPKKDR